LAFIGPAEMQIYNAMHCCQDRSKIIDLVISAFIVVTIWGAILTNIAEIIFVQLCNNNKKEDRNE